MFSDKDKFLKAIEIFKEKYEKGEIISEKKYQKNLIIKSLIHFKSETEKLKLKKLSSHYKKIFIILPANVPTEFLEFIPIFLSYNSEFFIKLPLRNRFFVKKFFDILDLKNIKAEYLSHRETLKKIQDYDFIVASGSSELENIIHFSRKPYKFFGPKFTFAILERFSEENIERILEDFLSFDTEGCLSVRFIFTKFNISKKFLLKTLKKLRREYYPQRDFNKKLFQYYNAINMYYTKDYIITKTEAIMEVEKMPLYFPQRTLFIHKFKDYDEIINFLGIAKNSVQGIANEKGEKIKFFEDNTSVSIFFKYGNSQFPPLGWFFERGTTLLNFFSIPTRRAL